jgi:hypothetical protein
LPPLLLGVDDAIIYSNLEDLVLEKDVLVHRLSFARQRTIRNRPCFEYLDCLPIEGLFESLPIFRNAQTLTGYISAFDVGLFVIFFEVVSQAEAVMTSIHPDAVGAGRA